MKKIILIIAIFTSSPFLSATECGWCWNNYINCVDNNYIRWKLYMKNDMQYAHDLMGCNNGHLACCLGN